MAEGVYYQDKNIFRFRDLYLEVMRVARGSSFSYQFDSKIGAVVLTLTRRLALQGKDLKQLEAALSKDYNNLCSQYTDYLKSMTDDELVELYNNLRYPSVLVTKYLESRLPKDTIKSLAESSFSKTLDGREYLFDVHYWPDEDKCLHPSFDYNNIFDNDDDRDNNEDLSFLDNDIKTISRNINKAKEAKTTKSDKTNDDVCPLDDNINTHGNNNRVTSSLQAQADDTDDESIFSMFVASLAKRIENSVKDRLPTGDEDNQPSQPFSVEEESIPKKNASLPAPKSAESTSKNNLPITSQVHLTDADLNNFVCFNFDENKRQAVLQTIISRLSSQYPDDINRISELDVYRLKVLNVLIGPNRATSPDYFDKALGFARTVHSQLLGDLYLPNRSSVLGVMLDSFEDKGSVERVRIVENRIRNKFTDVRKFLLTYMSFLPYNPYSDAVSLNYSTTFISKDFDEFLIKTLNYANRRALKPIFYSCFQDKCNDYLGKCFLDPNLYHYKNCYKVDLADSKLNNAKSLKYKFGQDIDFQQIAKLCCNAFCNNVDHFAEMSQYSLPEQLKEGYKIAHTINLEKWSYVNLKSGFDSLASLYLFDLSSCSSEIQRFFAVIFNLLFNNSEKLSPENIKVKSNFVWSDKAELSKFFRKVDANADQGESFIEKIIKQTQQSELNIIAMLHGWYASTSIFNPCEQNRVNFSYGIRNKNISEIAILQPLFLLWSELIRYIELSKIMASVVSFNKTNQALYPNLIRALDYGELVLDLYNTMMGSLYKGLLTQVESVAKHSFEVVFISVSDFATTLTGIYNDILQSVKDALQSKKCTDASKIKYWDQGLKKEFVSIFGHLLDFGLFKLQECLGHVYYYNALRYSDFMLFDRTGEMPKPKAYISSDLLSYLPVSYTLVDYIPHEFAIREQVDSFFDYLNGDHEVYIDPDCKKVIIGDLEFEIVIDDAYIDRGCLLYNPTDQSLLCCIDKEAAVFIDHVKNNAAILLKFSETLDSYRPGLICINVCGYPLSSNEFASKIYADIISQIWSYKEMAYEFFSKLIKIKTKLLPEFKFNHNMTEVVYKGTTFSLEFTRFCDSACVVKYNDKLPLTCILPYSIFTVEFYQRVGQLLDSSLKKAKSTNIVSKILFNYYGDESCYWGKDWKVANLLEDNIVVFRDLKVKIHPRVNYFNYSFVIGNIDNKYDEFVHVFGPVNVLKDKQYFHALIIFLANAYGDIYNTIFEFKADFIRKETLRFASHIKTLKTNVTKFVEIASPEQAGHVEVLSKLVERIDQDYASIKQWSNVLSADLKSHFKKSDNNFANMVVGFRYITLLKEEVARFEKSINIAFNRLDVYKKTVKSWIPKKKASKKG